MRLSSLTRQSWLVTKGARSSASILGAAAPAELPGTPWQVYGRNRLCKLPMLLPDRKRTVAGVYDVRARTRRKGFGKGSGGRAGEGRPPAPAGSRTFGRSNTAL